MSKKASTPINRYYNDFGGDKGMLIVLNIIFREESYISESWLVGWLVVGLKPIVNVKDLGPDGGCPIWESFYAYFRKKIYTLNVHDTLTAI